MDRTEAEVDLGRKGSGKGLDIPPAISALLPSRSLKN